MKLITSPRECRYSLANTTPCMHPKAQGDCNTLEFPSHCPLQDGIPTPKKTERRLRSKCMFFGKDTYRGLNYEYPMPRKVLIHPCSSNLHTKPYCIGIKCGLFIEKSNKPNEETNTSNQT